MATDSRENQIRELMKRSIEDGLMNVPFMIEIFRAKEFDLNKVVTNELDFLLGAVLSTIIERHTLYCFSRGVNLSDAEIDGFNVLLFSNASKFRDEIKEIIGV